MRIKILNAGLLATVQDLGRPDFLSQGVPLAGAMDSHAAKLANIAIGNALNDAIIEFTYGNASFSCETDLLLAYAGNGAKLVASDKQLPVQRAIFVPAGTIIKLINNDPGARTYLAIAGGITVPKILGSRSTYIPADFGGMHGRALKKDDLIDANGSLSETSAYLLISLYGEQIKYPSWGISKALIPPAEKGLIRIFKGRETNWFIEESLQKLLSEPFSVSLQSNRMGIHLKGPLMQRNRQQELLSTAVTAGTLQVTGSGEIILLMADCQTTGGYPRIAQVASVDLRHCAQLKPNDKIHFKIIDFEEAEQLYLEQEQNISKLALAIKVKI